MPGASKLSAAGVVRMSTPRLFSPARADAVSDDRFADNREDLRFTSNVARQMINALLFLALFVCALVSIGGAVAESGFYFVGGIVSFLNVLFFWALARVGLAAAAVLADVSAFLQLEAARHQPTPPKATPPARAADPSRSP